MPDLRFKKIILNFYDSSKINSIFTKSTILIWNIRQQIIKLVNGVEGPMTTLRRGLLIIVQKNVNRKQMQLVHLVHLVQSLAYSNSLFGRSFSQF